MSRRTRRPAGVEKSASKSRNMIRVATIGLSVIGPLIGLVSNVASNTLPREWEPYLWLSWPLLGLLGVVYILLSWCERF